VRTGVKLIVFAGLLLGWPESMNAAQGFGSQTPGGAGLSVVHVTSLEDGGPGSLREALAGGERTVVFAVGGVIRLASTLRILSSFVTVDGLSAPSPGITLDGAGLEIDGSHGGHDVVVRGLRVRNAGDRGNDSLAIRNGVHQVVVESVSLDGCGDGNLDITRGAHDVTVAWSIFSGCDKNSLIKFGTQRVSLHHNVFVDGRWRNPWISYTTESSDNLSPDLMVDMRNNVVWGWDLDGGGTGVECGAKANIVANYFSSPDAPPLRQANAIMVQPVCPAGGNGGIAHTSSNVSADGLWFDVNVFGNVPEPFPAAPVATGEPCTEARSVLAAAGALPRDAVDTDRLAAITIRDCADITPPKCAGRYVTLLGTDGPDALVGSPFDDVIHGRDGNDDIGGAEGNDLICGGRGNDVLNGGKGDDSLRGGKDADVVRGKGGSDALRGGSGNDVLEGGGGGDQMKGGAGDDSIVDPDGPNEIDGKDGIDRCVGAPGDEVVNCES
jgi:pectate lyase